MQNTRETPSKLANLQHVVNKTLLIILFAQIVLCTISDILANSWVNSNLDNPQDLWYLFPEGTTADNTTLNSYIAYWFTFFILYCNLVPISLYVTLEMCNAFQAHFIDSDLEMYDEENDCAALCRSTNLVQELGQIEYVFSDKTGTLTQNVMQFKRCIIRGIDFIYGDTDGDESVKEFRCATLQKLRLAEKSTSGHTDLERFLLIMAVAHTVTVQYHDEEGYVYHAESPDEKALVEGAAACGVRFVKREGNVVVIKDLRDDKDKKCKFRRFKTLAVNEFNSTRKRMSVVVRELPTIDCEMSEKSGEDTIPSLPENESNKEDGKIFCFCKGADNVMMDLADKGNRWISSDSGQKLMDAKLFDCAVLGLRTLVMASREVSEEEYEEWHKMYDAACTAMEGRREKLMAAGSAIEKNLYICGASAIEDKLQTGVADCIADLHSADIKLWVLTGDKVETAINIGRSTAVLQPEMRVLKLALPDNLERKSNSREAAYYVQKRLHAIVQCIRTVMTAHGDPRHMTSDAIDKKLKELDAKKYSNNSEEKLSNSTSEAQKENEIGEDEVTWHDLQNLALVITGPCLQHIVGIEKNSPFFAKKIEMEHLLRDVGVLCRVLIACRVSPLQKALLVRLIKDGVEPTPITLAIGDGANDVSMIQEAHLGVGISGREGMQAVNASDFAIGQFRFLKRLLLIHGRWNYRRACKVILYTFYKNVVITFTLFFYTFLTAFSGTSLYESVLYASYNVFFCAWPILMVGIFDQDVTEELVIEQPWLYMSGRLNLDLNMWKMVECVIVSIVHSIVVGIWPLVALPGMSQGNLGGLYCFGTTVFTCMVLVVNMRCAIITHTWNKYTVLSFIATFLVFFSFIIIYSLLSSYNPAYYFVGIELLKSRMFYVVITGVPFTALLIDIVTEYLRLQFLYDPIDAARDVLRIREERRKSSIFHRKTSIDEKGVDGANKKMRKRYHSAGEAWKTVSRPMEHVHNMLQNWTGLGRVKKRRRKSVHGARTLTGNILRPGDSLLDERKNGNRKYRRVSSMVESSFAFSHPTSNFGYHSRNVSKIPSLKAIMNTSIAEESKIDVSITHPSRKMSSHSMHRRKSKELEKEQPHAKSETEPTLNRPKDIKFLQQKLPSWRPVWSTLSMVYVLMFLGVFFVLFGVIIWYSSHEVVMLKAVYGCPIGKGSGDDTSAAGYCNPSVGYTGRYEYSFQDQHVIHSHEHGFFESAGNAQAEADSDNEDSTGQRKNPLGTPQPRIAVGDSAEVTFTLTKKMSFPLLVYYELENFFQNHNIYMLNRCDSEMQGNDFDRTVCSTTCSHYLDESEDKTLSDSTRVYSPCGLIAHSLFNDNYELKATPTKYGNPAMDAVEKYGLTMSSSGIAWSSDMSTIFKNHANYPNEKAEKVYLYEKYPNTITENEGIENEHFAVWMRVAAFPKFLKLYGKIEETATSGSYLPAGSVLTFKINSRFRVATFQGSKALVLSTTSWVGGRNFFLGIAYICFGGLCVLSAILMLLKERKCPRLLPQARDKTIDDSGLFSVPKLKSQKLEGKQKKKGAVEMTELV
eukprot:g1023.t1